MAMIPQISIFDNTEIYDNLGYLERVKLILDNIPDEKLLDKIREDKDVRGRKGIPLEALMNICWARKILQHNTMAKMLRELSRNKGRFWSKYRSRWKIFGFICPKRK